MCAVSFLHFRFVLLADMADVCATGSKQQCDLQRVFGGGFTASSALRRLKAPSARGGRNEHAGAQERGSACMQ